MWLGRLDARKNPFWTILVRSLALAKAKPVPLLSQMTTPGLNLNFSVSDDNMQQDSDEF